VAIFLAMPELLAPKLSPEKSLASGRETGFS
jgi:hypothetical protein